VVRYYQSLLIYIFFFLRHELFTNVEVDEYGLAVTNEHGCPYYLSMHLPSNLFKDFVDVGPVTWESFSKYSDDMCTISFSYCVHSGLEFIKFVIEESCFVREINTYVFACSIVETYRENTLLGK
jgi:hypothetical protein